MKKDKYLFIIGGPTASGKTQKAIDLALEWDTEIISADSRQFYKEMNIGTAKPSTYQLNLVPHHFINNIAIHDSFDVAMYEKQVLNLLKDLFNKYDKVIMVGGSGLFIRSVTDGLDDFPDIDQAVKDEVRDIIKNEGIEIIQELVKKKDPVFYSKVDLNNPRRLQRAAEIIKQTGQPISAFQKNTPKERPFNIIKKIIEVPRNELYNRINQRVLDMVKNGLEEEAKSLMEFRHLIPLQTVGYSEWFRYFEGEYNKERAIELIQQNTRNYAKRQMTWLRNDGNWEAL